jgi:hypothetical protein
MVCFKEEMGEIYLVDNDMVISKIIEPAVLWDSKIQRIIQVGNKGSVVSFYTKAIEVCKQKQMNVAFYWKIIELPRDVEVLNRILIHPEELQYWNTATAQEIA